MAALVSSGAAAQEAAPPTEEEQAHALADPLDAFVFDRRIDAEAFARGIVERNEVRRGLGPDGTLGSDAAACGAHERDPSTHVVRGLDRRERELQRAAVTLQVGLPCDLVSHPRTPDAAASDSSLFRFYKSALALRQSDPALRGGGLSVLSAAGDAVAFERRLGGDVRVVALNRGDADQFLSLPAGRAPAPFTPVFVSSGSVARVPGLVAGVGDTDVVYGLRIPARTAVVFRPADGVDVRPRGLDE